MKNNNEYICNGMLMEVPTKIFNCCLHLVVSACMGFFITECKVLIGLDRATSMLISQNIYDAINAIKRLHHMYNSHSKLRPGPDHHYSFGIEILR